MREADFGWGSEFIIHPRVNERVISASGGPVRVWERTIGGERYRFGAGREGVTVAKWRRSRRRWEASRWFSRV